MFRSWTHIFKAARQNKQNFDDVTDFLLTSRRDSTSHVARVREGVSIADECRRLVAGFETAMKTSEAARMFGDVKKTVLGAAPDWQKSTLLPVSEKQRH